jgi:hypothetical protein
MAIRTGSRSALARWLAESESGSSSPSLGDAVVAGVVVDSITSGWEVWLNDKVPCRVYNSQSREKSKGKEKCCAGFSGE